MLVICACSMAFPQNFPRDDSNSTSPSLPPDAPASTPNPDQNITDPANNGSAAALPLPAPENTTNPAPNGTEGLAGNGSATYPAPDLSNTTNTPANNSGNATRLTFDRPIYLTFLFFVDGRYVDETTGDDILPAQTVLTFAGDNNSMAVQYFMRADDDGTPILQLHSFWGDPVFERTTASLSETFSMRLQYDSAGQILGLELADADSPDADTLQKRQIPNAFGEVADSVGSDSASGNGNAAHAEAPDRVPPPNIMARLVSQSFAAQTARSPEERTRLAAKIEETLFPGIASNDDFTRAVVPRQWMLGQGGTSNDPSNRERWQRIYNWVQVDSDQAAKIAADFAAREAANKPKPKFSWFLDLFKGPRFTGAVLDVVPGTGAEPVSEITSTGVKKYTWSEMRDKLRADGQIAAALRPSKPIEFDASNYRDQGSRFGLQTVFENPKAEAKAQRKQAEAAQRESGLQPKAAPALPDMAVARTAGKWLALNVASKALTALDAVGFVVGAAFIVVDFLHHDVVGGALGAAGLGAGIAIGAAFQIASAELGPLGWVIGGLLSAFLAIIPGLAMDNYDHQPWVVDVQGILQWSFFGDAEHTGNEKCRTSSATRQADPNCVAVFGAAMIAQVLRIPVYDAGLFLMQYNQGFPMSIEEMAPWFKIASPGHPSDTADQIAVIDCHNKWAPSTNEVNGPRPDRDFCTKPTYSINRTLITIPHLNLTAVQVADRMSKGNASDCRMENYPNGQYLRNYNLTIRGIPTTIACGINPGLNVSGQLVDPTTLQAISNETVSAASNSSAGIAGLYIAPPPKSSFAPLPCACFQDTSNNKACLLNGNYTIGNNRIAPDMAKISQLTLAPRAYINLKFHYTACRGGCLTYNNTNYTTNISNPDPQFHPQPLNLDLRFLANNPANEPTPLTVFCDPQATLAGFCVFTGTNFTGESACFGVGGDDLPSKFQNNSKSMRIVRQTRVEIFAHAYGDPSGTPLTTDQPDLSALSAGGDQNFGRNFVAAWASA